MSRKDRTFYVIWHGMKSRCLNPKNKFFHRYGGRGITVCQEWLDFNIFEEWCKKSGYEQGLELDRINNDAGYSPENCRFVTRAANVQNSSKSKISVELSKEIRDQFNFGVSALELAEAHGLSRSAVYKILANDSWEDKDYEYKKRKVKKLSDQEKSTARMLFSDGESLKSLCAVFGVGKSSMHYILNGPKT